MGARPRFRAAHARIDGFVGGGAQYSRWRVDFGFSSILLEAGRRLINAGADPGIQHGVVFLDVAAAGEHALLAWLWTNHRPSAVAVGTPCPGCASPVDGPIRFD